MRVRDQALPGNGNPAWSAPVRIIDAHRND